MLDLVVGTAQWGSAYGITNRSGRLSDESLGAIVSQAEMSGVTALDTALAYGDAQIRVAPYAHRFWVSTKVAGAQDVPAQVGSCLEQLRVVSLDAVMLHDWDALDACTRVSAVMGLAALRDEGIIDRIGVSTYGVSGVEAAVDVFSSADMMPGIVQVPANAIDRRLDRCPLLNALSARDCIVQVRSVFLQGLLTGSGGVELDSHPDVVAYRNWSAQNPGGAVGAALAHVKALPWAGQVVIGAASVSEWAEVCRVWRDIKPRLAPETLSSEDENLIDPRRWLPTGLKWQDSQ